MHGTTGNGVTLKWLPTSQNGRQFTMDKDRLPTDSDDTMIVQVAFLGFF